MYLRKYLSTSLAGCTVLVLIIWTYVLVMFKYFEKYLNPCLVNSIVFMSVCVCVIVGLL